MLTDPLVPTPRRCARIAPTTPRSHPRAPCRSLRSPSAPIIRSRFSKAISRPRRRCRDRTRHGGRPPSPHLGRRAPRTGAVVYRGSAPTLSRDVYQRRKQRRGMDWYRRSNQECVFLQRAPSGFRSGTTETRCREVGTAWLCSQRRRYRLGIRCRLVSVVSGSFER